MQRTERGVVSFYASSLKQLLSSRWHTAVGRDRQYQIGGHAAVLPPAHRLPWFQSVFPSYDRYAEAVLVALTDGAERPLLIDVGANVGDTVLLATTAVPRLHVRAVEGNPEFVSYLRRNTGHLGDRLDVQEKFVQVSLEESITYSHTGSTGGFKAAGSDGAAPALGHDFVSVEELLAGTEQHDLVVWKSDTDGLDLPILLSGWDRIEARCSVIWFEFDPFMDIHGGRQLPELCERIQRSGRVMHVVDNTGRSMMTVSAEAATDVLLGLTRWLSAPSVPGETSYLDIWLVDPDLAHHDEVTGALTLGRAGGRAVGAS